MGKRVRGERGSGNAEGKQVRATRSSKQPQRLTSHIWKGGCTLRTHWEGGMIKVCDQEFPIFCQQCRGPTMLRPQPFVLLWEQVRLLTVELATVERFLGYALTCFFQSGIYLRPKP